MLISEIIHLIAQFYVNFFVFFLTGYGTRVENRKPVESLSWSRSVFYVKRVLRRLLNVLTRRTDAVFFHLQTFKDRVMTVSSV